ncbi:DUF1552 domain-containing protein [Rubripirellula sp.]|nr:DUF1552 domain-containing protein [Rubripirellula sp.]MDB4644950.1 DUF1552 domain-containing protein [Rubripirellula sp.]
MNVSRRHFLRGSTGVVALPALESLDWKKFASAASVDRPAKRMVFLSFGWGVTRDDWFPDKSISGTDYELPAGLKPLQRHKEDITVLQNLSNQFSSEAHWGSTFYLTGANRYAEPGKSFHNSVSADQVAAEKLGLATRFTSIQLGCKGAENSGHGPGLSLAWNRQGKPVAGLDNPVAAYHKLFSDGKTPLAERQVMLQKQRSVLDAVMEDAKDVGRGLGSNDADKLGEYLQSVRDIETRLSKEEQWLDVPKTRPTTLPDEPQGTIAGYEEIKVMYDLMIAAMQVDATRVFTYRQPVESLLKSFGATITGHNMSHYTNGDRKSVSQTRDQKQSELLAYFIDRLKQTKESDGSRLFDHVAMSYGSNINSIHYLTNCPTVITGGGAGVAHGRHLVLDPGTPLANLWLSLLRGVGVDAASLGDSSGVIRELFV